MDWDNIIVWIILIMIYLYLYFLRRRKKIFLQTDSQLTGEDHSEISLGVVMNTIQPPPIPEEQLPVKDNEEKIIVEKTMSEEGSLPIEEVCRGILWGEVLAKPKALQKGGSYYTRR